MRPCSWALTDARSLRLAFNDPASGKVQMDEQQRDVRVGHGDTYASARSTLRVS